MKLIEKMSTQNLYYQSIEKKFKLTIFVSKFLCICWLHQNSTKISIGHSKKNQKDLYVKNWHQHAHTKTRIGLKVMWLN